MLHAFTGGSDGAYPEAGLIADSNGNLYGTTRAGGASGVGTVFELMRPATAGGAWTETVLHAFTGGSDGAHPEAGLIADSKGNLYGTTAGGGGSGFGSGTVFELMPPATAGGAWTETVRHAFTGGSDGLYPIAGLIADSKGTLFGTTMLGGSSNVGTIFLLTSPANAFEVWREAVLYAFTGGSNEGNPFCPPRLRATPQPGAPGARDVEHQRPEPAPLKLIENAIENFSTLQNSRIFSDAP